MRTRPSAIKQLETDIPHLDAAGQQASADLINTLKSYTSEQWDKMLQSADEPPGNNYGRAVGDGSGENAPPEGNGNNGFGGSGNSEEPPIQSSSVVPQPQSAPVLNDLQNTVNTLEQNLSALNPAVQQELNPLINTVQTLINDLDEPAGQIAGGFDGIGGLREPGGESYGGGDGGSEFDGEDFASLSGDGLQYGDGGVPQFGPDSNEEPYADFAGAGGMPDGQGVPQFAPDTYKAPAFDRGLGKQVPNQENANGFSSTISFKDDPAAEYYEPVPNETVPNEPVPNETVPNETVPNDKPAVQQRTPEQNHELFGNSEGVADWARIEQGSTGDCWFMSTLISNARLDSRMLSDNLWLNKDGTVTVSGLHDPNTGEPIDPITVNPVEDNPLYARVTDAEGNSTKFSAAYELAIEDVMQKYPMLMKSGMVLPTAMEGGLPTFAQTILTGQKAIGRNLESYSEDEVWSMLDEANTKKPVEVDDTGHGSSVYDTRVVNGEKQVGIIDPNFAGKIQWMNYRDFIDEYKTIYAPEDASGPKTLGVPEPLPPAPAGAVSTWPLEDNPFAYYEEE